MKPICVKCQRFFRCKKNDFPFVEGMPIGDSDVALPGTAAPAHWQPYKLWFGDKWECEGCGATIVVGVAKVPLAIHHMPEFQPALVRHNPELQVNDC